AGALWGPPPGGPAGIAVLELLDKPGTYEKLETLGARLEAGVGAALQRHGRGCINRHGSMWTVFFGAERVRNADEARACDTAAFARFFIALLERGVYLPPSQFEAAFISLAHSEDDVDLTVQAVEQALAALH